MFHDVIVKTCKSETRYSEVECITFSKDSPLLYIKARSNRAINNDELYIWETLIFDAYWTEGPDRILSITFGEKDGKVIQNGGASARGDSVDGSER